MYAHEIRRSASHYCCASCSRVLRMYDIVMLLLLPAVVVVIVVIGWFAVVDFGLLSRTVAYLSSPEGINKYVPAGTYGLFTRWSAQQ